MTIHQPSRRIIRFEAYDEDGTLYEFHGIAQMTMNFKQTMPELDPWGGYKLGGQSRSVLDTVELKMLPNHEGPIITVSTGERL